MNVDQASVRQRRERASVLLLRAQEAATERRQLAERLEASQQAVERAWARAVGDDRAPPSVAEMLDEMQSRHEELVARARADAEAHDDARRRAETALEAARARLAEAKSARGDLEALAASVAARTQAVMSAALGRAKRTASALGLAATAAALSWWALFGGEPPVILLPLV